MSNKLYIVGGISFLIIIFILILSFDDDHEGGGGGRGGSSSPPPPPSSKKATVDNSASNFSGNKSLDTIYDDAKGNDPLSNARLTSKVDLSTSENSCSFMITYTGNNKREVECTSCIKKEDQADYDDPNNKFCLKYEYGSGDDLSSESSAFLDETYSSSAGDSDSGRVYKCKGNDNPDNDFKCKTGKYITGADNLVQSGNHENREKTCCIPDCERCTDDGRTEGTCDQVGDGQCTKYYEESEEKKWICKVDSTATTDEIIKCKRDPARVCLSQCSLSDPAPAAADPTAPATAQPSTGDTSMEGWDIGAVFISAIVSVYYIVLIMTGSLVGGDLMTKFYYLAIILFYWSGTFFAFNPSWFGSWEWFLILWLFIIYFSGILLTFSAFVKIGQGLSSKRAGSRLESRSSSGIAI